MTDYELLRIISFLERMRAPFDETLRRPDPDPTWNMVLFLIRSYLRGENVLMSTLATTANVPAASAMRRIHRMIEDSEIDLRARSPSARTFYLKPSKRLRTPLFCLRQEGDGAWVSTESRC
jgi:multiple sugar transport system substrate-binding protein